MANTFSGASAQITHFSFNTHAVRIVMRDGNPWFVAADVCAALDYKNSRKAVADHLDDDERCNQPLHRGGTQTLINESGLYALVLRSRKPEARKFAKWVTAEVLPSIRKTGGYGITTEMPKTGEKLIQARREFMAALNRVPREFQIDIMNPEVMNMMADGFLAFALGGRRWMLEFDERGNQVIRSIASDESVLRYEDLPAVIQDPGCYMEPELLEQISTACTKKLTHRLKSVIRSNSIGFRD